VEFGVDAGVMLSEGTGAENGDFDFGHARSLPANGGAENENCKVAGIENVNAAIKTIN
jgi:hypothetical protein